MCRLSSGCPRLAHALVLVAGLLAASQAGAAPTELVPAEKGPGGQALYAWEVDESWPGDSQYDARLDKAVSFWRAGIALAEVFAGIEQQTGARLGFWPEGGENPRVRVNLYLNSQTPPTLREVMAQLAWVTDCSFAYATPEGTPSYCLLSSSIAEGAASARQEAAGPTGLQRAAVEREERNARNEQAVQRKLEALREALKLSREEAIAKYDLVDDFFLLTLLDPARRTIAEFTLRKLDENGELLQSWEWEDLSEEEQAAALAVAPPRPDRWQRDAPLEAAISTASDGVLSFTISQTTLVNGILHQETIGHDAVVDTHDPPLFMDYQAQVNLAGLLGDPIPAGKEGEARYLQWTEMRRQAARQRQVARLVSSPPAGIALSPTAQLTLASLSLPLQEKRAYALWELQEWTAFASGLNLVSDCFWQPRREVAGPESALAALTASAAVPVPWGERLSETSLQLRRVGFWEWGDAGCFLRFRSTARGLFRASLLPKGALERVDGMLAPHLPTPPRRGLTLPIDLDALLSVVPALDDLQLEYGGRLIYEDPADEVNAWRQALREGLLGVTANQADIFPLLASLREEQWRALHTTGVDWADLDPGQQSRLIAVRVNHGEVPNLEALTRLRLRLRGTFRAPEKQSAPSRRTPFQLEVCTLRTQQADSMRPDPSTIHCLEGRWAILSSVDVAVPPPHRPERGENVGLPSGG